VPLFRFGAFEINFQVWDLLKRIWNDKQRGGEETPGTISTISDGT
jgi:hypothetical protein